MTAGYALNIERKYGQGIILVASKHNLRQIAAEIGADSHIDAARIADNFIVRGPSTAKEVSALAKSLMDAAGVLKCRKGAVTALELLFTLPAATGIDPRQYFEQATTWAEQHFGVPVLSCIAHMDEGSPHAHALLLPLVDGRMGGSDLHGGKAKLAAMQTSFHEAVGAPHGLPKYVPKKPLSAPVRAAAMALARQSLQVHAALNDDIIDALLVPHTKDPSPLLLALGIDMPRSKPRGKDFVSIMTAVCKPERGNPIGKDEHYPIGKEIQAMHMMSLPDTCVGKALPTASIPPARSSATSIQHLDQQQARQSAGRPIASKMLIDHPEGNRQDQKATSQPKTGMPWSEALRALALKQHHRSAPLIASLATAPQAVPVHDASPAGYQQPGGTSDVSKTGCISLTPCTIQIQGVSPVSISDDFQRERDDGRPADTWCPDLGEFVTMPGLPTRPIRSARASPADIALDSIHQLLALVSIAEHEPPAGKESRP